MDENLAAGETPAGLPLASFGQRAAAAVIDTAIVFALSCLAFFACLLIFGWDDGNLGLAVYAGITASVVVCGAYSPLLLVRRGGHAGQTFGKQVIGIRVVDAGGGPLTRKQAILREVALRTVVLGCVLSCIPVIGPIIFLGWYLCVLVDERRRTVHDRSAKTLVVCV